MKLTLLIVFTAAELFFLRKFKAKKDKTAIKSDITSIAVLWLVYIAIYIFTLFMPDAAFALIIVALFTDSFCGYFLNLYNSTKKYDRLQHVFGSFSFAVFFYFLLSNFLEYGGSKVFQSFYILLLGVFYGTIYEIIEFISDSKNNEKMQRGLRDTDFDIISNIIGSLTAAVLGYFVFI